MKIRPIFVRWPWLTIPVLLVALPLFLLAGMLQGFLLWMEEARDVPMILRHSGPPPTPTGETGTPR